MAYRVGYILQEPPRYSETFIANEIRALAAFHLPSHIFCLRGDTTSGPDFSPASLECIGSADDNVSMLLSDWIDAFEERPITLLNELQAAHKKFISRPDSMRITRRLEPFFVLACAVKIAARCKELRIRHLHCHYATLPTEVGHLVNRMSGITYSFTGHAKDIFTNSPERLARRMSRASFAVTCSDTGRQHLQNSVHPEDAKRIYRIYHGIDSANWKIERRPDHANPLVLAVGRMTPKKGFETLIEAAAILRDRGISMRFEIAGEGRMRSTYESLIQERSLEDRFTLPGALSQDSIKERMSTCLACVVPSVILDTNNQDGLANVMLEAMAAGVPVVVSRIPALLEIAEERKTAMTFEPGNAVQLADHLATLQSDPDLAAALAANARARVVTMSTHAAAERLARLFSEYAD